MKKILKKETLNLIIELLGHSFESPESNKEIIHRYNCKLAFLKEHQSENFEKLKNIDSSLVIDYYRTLYAHMYTSPIKFRADIYPAGCGGKYELENLTEVVFLILYSIGNDLNLDTLLNNDNWSLNEFREFFSKCDNPIYNINCEMVVFESTNSSKDLIREVSLFGFQELSKQVKLFQQYGINIDDLW